MNNQYSLTKIFNSLIRNAIIFGVLMMLLEWSKNSPLDISQVVAAFVVITLIRFWSSMATAKTAKSIVLMQMHQNAVRTLRELEKKQRDDHGA